MVTHHSHHFVSLHIVHIENVQVVETTIERLTDLKLQVYCTVKYSQLLELNHTNQIIHLSLPGIDSLKFLDEHRTR